MFFFVLSQVMMMMRKTMMMRKQVNRKRGNIEIFVISQDHVRNINDAQTVNYAILFINAIQNFMINVTDAP